MYILLLFDSDSADDPSRVVTRYREGCTVRDMLAAGSLWRKEIQAGMGKGRDMVGILDASHVQVGQRARAPNTLRRRSG